MLGSKEDFLSFRNLFYSKDRVLEKKYSTWKMSSQYVQVFAATLLTGFLYIIYYVVDSLIVPSEFLPLMANIHLYINAPFLFFISLLALLKKSFPLMTFLLIVAPVIGAMGNLFLLYTLDIPNTYITENYLILFWIFTISGLRLSYATISALLTSGIVVCVTYFFFAFEQNIFIMHCFWILAAFSFGFLGAYLIERSDRKIFFAHEQLVEQASTDSLTGLYNRAKLDDILQHELDRSQRFKHMFGLVVLDIDYFKMVNDTYGHQVGDSVLIQISDILKGHIRSSDFLIRWGGEEFIIIYLEIDKGEAIRLAEEIRRDIEQHVFQTVGSKTASLGVTLCKDNDTTTSIIQRADKALYIAKEKGRNRTEFL